MKFGRYHIFLHKLIKPEAVSLRTLLWKNYHQKNFNLKPPTFGLNFIEDEKLKIKISCFYVDLKSLIIIL